MNATSPAASAGPTPSSDLLLRTDHDGVRLLTLNRPQRRNALDTELTTLLLQALREADADASVGAVVLAGAGPCFCAGADLGEFKGERANAAAQARRGDLYLDLLLVFEQIQVPIVAAVHGPALGMGAALANLCDMAVLGQTARIGYPEVHHGMVPSLMIPIVQACSGQRMGFELLALGEMLGAEQALANGLANRVVPEEQLNGQALALAQRLAAVDRQTLRETKGLAARMKTMTLPEALRAGRDASRRRAEA